MPLLVKAGENVKVVVLGNVKDEDPIELEEKVRSTLEDVFPNLEKNSQSITLLSLVEDIGNIYVPSLIVKTRFRVNILVAIDYLTSSLLFVPTNSTVLDSNSITDEYMIHYLRHIDLFTLNLPANYLLARNVISDIVKLYKMLPIEEILVVEYDNKILRGKCLDPYMVLGYMCYELWKFTPRPVTDDVRYLIYALTLFPAETIQLQTTNMDVLVRMSDLSISEMFQLVRRRLYPTLLRQVTLWKDTDGRIVIFIEDYYPILDTIVKTYFPELEKYYRFEPARGSRKLDPRFKESLRIFHSIIREVENMVDRLQYIGQQQ
ncbi:MAG: hypothetical protein GXO26_02755 [Crenarchaeota archaeon]|nr:hypothetical protein [Thermoproteota archaeon]